MKKLLIFGGTFNPIHNGHINILKSFIDYVNPDKSILMPTNIPSHKSYEDEVSAKDRYNMCVESLIDLKNAEVSDLEIKRSGKSYTVDTLKQMKKIYKEYDLFFITGADMFMTLQFWKDPGTILNLCTFCSTPRQDIDINRLKTQAEYLKRSYNYANFLLLDMELFNISSTQIRNMVKEGLNIEKLVPAGVLKYIIQKNLYLK